jgi:serine/threonine-protein kinase
MISEIGRYKIQEQIGSGVMGETYRARDMQHGRLVAIRVLPPAIANDRAKRTLLLADAQAAAGLSHPSIVTPIEIGDEPDRLFLVFDFIPGETLEKTIAGRPMDTRQAIDLAAEIADALGEGHAEGVPHGDLTTSHVIVTPTGHAKLLNHGFSSWTRNQPVKSDDAGDMIALGGLMFEMLTGKATTSPSPRVTLANPLVPVELDPIVQKAFSKDPDLRYGSGSTLAAELRAFRAVLDVRDDVHAHALEPKRSLGKWIVGAAIAAAAAIGWFILRR